MIAFLPGEVRDFAGGIPQGKLMAAIFADGNGRIGLERFAERPGPSAVAGVGHDPDEVGLGRREIKGKASRAARQRIIGYSQVEAIYAIVS